MKCPNCGAVTVGEVCPACAISPTPENVAGYSSLPDLRGKIGAVFRDLKIHASRHWGSYHDFVAGTGLQPGEQELYRTPVRTVTTFAVERQMPVVGQGLSILTDRRLMARDEAGRGLELPLADIAAAQVRREDASRSGPTWYVALLEAGGRPGDPPHEVRLVCPDRAACAAPAEQIETVRGEHHQERK